MGFPRIYVDEACPLDGYEGYSFRVLANPTAQEKTDWWTGHFGLIDCQDCAKLGGQRRKLSDAEPAKRCCATCQAARERKGRAAVAIYGQSHVEGFDFSSPEASLASFEQDGVPDELLGWLFDLPNAIWQRRADEIKKKLSTS